VPAADIITPNHFELDRLIGRESRQQAEVHAAIERLHALGPRVALVTSLVTEETPADAVELVASEAKGQHRLRTPKLKVAGHGAGDAIAALFLLHYLRTGSASEALARAASALYGVLKRTAAAGADEMLLIEAQHELVNPTETFRPEPL
jgi:pyridoxine kinase